MSRYAELMYPHRWTPPARPPSSPPSGDISKRRSHGLRHGAAFTTLGRVDPFSPQFQDMTLEKGAMVFHMLRFQLGNEGFQNFLRTLLSQFTDKGYAPPTPKPWLARSPRKSSLPSSRNGLMATRARPISPTSTTLMRLEVNGKGFQHRWLHRGGPRPYSTCPLIWRIETEGRAPR